MPNIMAIFPGDKRLLGGCEIYRTTMPFHFLNKKYPNWNCTWSFYDALYKRAQMIGRGYWSQLALSNDIFIFPRVYFKEPQAREEFEILVRGLQAIGRHVLYEVDDDLTNEHRIVIDGDAMGCASLCEATTVTTTYLAELMTSRTGKKSYVIPNMIGPDIWYAQTTLRASPKINIGLTGSSTHKEDWRIFGEVLPDLVQRDDVHLTLAGFHPDYLDNLPNTSYLPGLTYEKYAQVIQNCDIIIGAVNDDPFNFGKSSIKIVEGMAARRKVAKLQYGGAACIATNHPIYNSTIIPEKNGLLVEHTAQSWKDGLLRLIEDQPLRERLQIAGHEWVDKNHNITKKVSLWKNAFEAVLRTTPS